MIIIDSNIKETGTFAQLGIVVADIIVETKNPALKNQLDHEEQLVKQSPSEKLLKHLDDNKVAYKTLGKDPKRYPNSANALNKRIMNDKGLYYINNIVNLNNLLSIRYGISFGSYDLNMLDGTVVWKKASDGESYQGIGKGDVNLANLPVLMDNIGIFGSPTSDSKRAMITDKTRRNHDGSLQFQ